ncbi:SWIM zinc finger family protein [Galactobacter caseinivorans]|uniref:SWIM zinc finger family protein n=1 Tax=Galactobacter caseinivorans TaxID=2676123 RepID=UPI0018F53FC6|nr:SWIM zinc finger family protein [Galactobacter caseinivorans]
MSLRTYVRESAVSSEGLGLALAPALTPAGNDLSPSFFHGFATHPQVLARGLVTLADITATRYFKYVPTVLRDPVLTAHGDRLRAEVFSACNGVYARLNVTQAGLDGGEIGHGTTNVDVGPSMRTLLSGVGRSEALHLDVGSDGLRAVTTGQTAVERPVQMPDRWIRALGNAAGMHHGMVQAFEVNQAAARAFIGQLPSVSATNRSGWLTPGRSGLRVALRASPGAVYINGLHRLSAMRRLLTHAQGLRAFGPADGSAGVAAVELLLPGGSLFLGLTEEAWRGHSGEGALLLGLASSTVLDDADLVSVSLAFEPVLDEGKLARESGLSPDRVRGALAVLAASGRVGWDVHDAAWFHRELPDDPDRVLKDNPRLVGARKLVEAGAVSPVPGRDAEWDVKSSGVTYRVRPEAGGALPRCTCQWVLKHGTHRGPCKHQLAVILVRDGDPSVPDAPDEADEVGAAGGATEGRVQL